MMWFDAFDVQDKCFYGLPTPLLKTENHWEMSPLDQLKVRSIELLIQSAIILSSLAVSNSGLRTSCHLEPPCS